MFTSPQHARFEVSPRGFNQGVLHMKGRTGIPPLVFGVVAGIVAAACSNSAAAAWLNETNGAEEADYAVLQFPVTLSAQAGAGVSTVYGRIYEGGLTEAAGASGSIIASLGYGPAGSDPRVSAGWNWVVAAFNVQVGNNDEYQGSFLAPIAPGAYSYTFRFSLDGGNDWTLADLDGAGTINGLDFSPGNLGTLNVSASPVPIPGGLYLMALPVAGILALSHRRYVRIAV
jgi:hypothetical protein